ncbi:transposase [Novosphingobium sp. NBM11]|uniref:IS66 family insertion sequence element accessory protein TnpB n=1 Tax=Novosphingobium sp. NBM11 TaxID=2596914 RepID=UPI0018920357|nr:IS66 family insertion sequence element accessory protein TnpB [Novosphingobium sp. NBM11]MBF5089161.1 transposase [Novosphingobium sp. NBM11]
MIGPGTGVRVYLACGVTDMRKGISGLAMLAQTVLRQKPASGAVFAFRGRRGKLPTFSIRFAPRDDRLPVASVLRNDAAGGAFPSRQAA